MFDFSLSEFKISYLGVGTHPFMCMLSSGVLRNGLDKPHLTRLKQKLPHAASDPIKVAFCSEGFIN